MFGKEKQSDAHQSDWVTKFEAGQWTDDEVTAARLLHAVRPDAIQIPRKERRALRQRLISQHNRRHNQSYAAWRYAMTAATLAAVAVLL